MSDQEDRKRVRVEDSNSKGLVVIVEPFYAGSHRYLCDCLVQKFGQDRVLVAGIEGNKKWHWRMLVGACKLRQDVEDLVRRSNGDQVDVIMFSAMMNVAELCGLNPSVSRIRRKLLYFHENQLEYPRLNEEAKQSQGQNDFNLVWNQIVSCLCVDHVYFNSKYNMDTFFQKIGPFINRKIPSTYRPNINIDVLKRKSSVLYVPITLPQGTLPAGNVNEAPLHLIWAHRWEHDKNPRAMLNVVKELAGLGVHIRISVLGECCSSAKEEFDAAKSEITQLDSVEILHWGRLEHRDDYLQVLRVGDVALSTANHEFFGVSMVEAAVCGCFPLCPNRLSYPELFPREALYNTDRQLFKKLREFARKPRLPRERVASLDWQNCLSKFLWETNNEEAKTLLEKQWEETFFGCF